MKKSILTIILSFSLIVPALAGGDGIGLEINSNNFDILRREIIKDATQDLVRTNGVLRETIDILKKDIESLEYQIVNMGVDINEKEIFIKELKTSIDFLNSIRNYETIETEVIKEKEVLPAWLIPGSIIAFIVHFI